MKLSHGRRPANGSRNESGETLVEIILTVVLISTTIVALVTALFTVVASSSASKRRAQSANEATTVVETIDRTVYIDCAGAGYNGALSTVPTPGFTPTITSVRYIADPGAATPTWQDQCPPGGDRGLQQITVKIESTRGSKVTTAVTVVKRRSVCPATVVTVPGEKC